MRYSEKKMRELNRDPEYLRQQREAYNHFLRDAESRDPFGWLPPEPGPAKKTNHADVQKAPKTEEKKDHDHENDN